ncbi:PEP-CTERM sorting domain-containing protein [Tolypothrix sp. FACHB-123]|uniref:PEP-CTERM sorting domain-containing protein n=1 Tax=Tolypothrix sp. FACHB-123 TaxID=2692868 RepID=UPI001684EE8A|nr:PEP-CTERM sorting domain-containing protein [Tolypothrix sp. FACHB-123]MBD2354150.1 PEP-CTERM sorting domain-containing protein [Tolypothrix sp. FACHB-123]
MVRSLFLHKEWYLRYRKNRCWPKIGVIIGKIGLVALSDLIFLATITGDRAFATKISLTNPSESICIKGKDACIKKIGSEILKDFDEVNTFLQIEPLSYAATRQGYNTDSFVVKLDARKKLPISHSLKLDDVPIVTIGGTEYREFILTINEIDQTNANKDSAKIVLEKLELFLGNSPDLTNYPNFKGRATKTFDLQPNTVVLEDINYENGSHDYFVYINNNLFANTNKDAKDRQYIYLFSQFRDAKGGAQSWSVRKLKRASLVPAALAGGGAGGGEILGGMIPFAGLLSLFGGGGGGGRGNAANLGNNQSGNNIRREIPVVPLPPAKGRNPATEVPEPSTVLASLIGIGLLAKGRSKFRYQKVKQDN